VRDKIPTGVNSLRVHGDVEKGLFFKLESLLLFLLGS
jgi:hypothetical protein